MKRLFLILFTTLVFGISAQAVSFRSNQSVCYGTEQIIFYSNGNVKLYDDGVLAASGTYSLVNDSGTRVVEIYISDNTLRCPVYMSKQQNITRLTFRGYTYTPCSR
jgi:hypothetical protein